MSNFSMPEDSPSFPPPEKRGMSSGMKALLLVGIILGVMALLCCGGLGYYGYLVKKGSGDDPGVITAKTKEITDISIPASLKPVISVHMPGFVTTVLYGDKGQNNSDSILALAAFGSMFRGQNEEQMRQQLNQPGMGTQGEQVLVKDTELKETQIRGQHATFTIATGIGAKSKQPRIQVTGVFEGKGGPVMLMLNADAQRINKDAAIKMIDSIR